MHEDALTESELASEGLSCESYGRMEPRDREYVLKRIRLYRSLGDQTLVARLLDAMASELADKGVILDVLEGRNPRGVMVVRMMVEDFEESGLDDIGGYYRRFFGGKAKRLLTGDYG